MYQEVEVEVNIIFDSPQIRKYPNELDEEIRKSIIKDYEGDTHIEVLEIEAAIENVRIKILTSVLITFNITNIKNIIGSKIRRKLSMGIKSIEFLKIREESEIYDL